MTADEAASDIAVVSADNDDDLPFGLLRSPRRVVFGFGRHRSLGSEAAGLGRRALICTDERFAATSEFTTILHDLSASGVAVQVWSRTEPELPSHQVEECATESVNHRPDIVIGIGGGSCMDLAKAVALLLSHGGSLASYYGENKVPAPILPVIAVPTTAGTGSEVTPVCVLNDAERELKIGISSPHLVPMTALCDPELTMSCPPALTASVGADALTHLIESYTAVRRGSDATSAGRVFVGKNAFSDIYALRGLELLASSLVRAHSHPDDRRARAEVMLAANAGGFALGVAGTAAAHALQYPLGALTHTPHGVGVGALLPYVMRFNLPVRIAEYGEIGRILGVADSTSPVRSAKSAIEAVDRLLHQIGMPPTLKDMGLVRQDIDHVARAGMQSTRLVENNPRKLTVEAMRSITDAAFSGNRDFAI